MQQFLLLHSAGKNHLPHVLLKFKREPQRLFYVCWTNKTNFTLHGDVNAKSQIWVTISPLPDPYQISASFLRKSWMWFTAY